MSLYGDALYQIKHNKDIRDSGGVVAIPWHGLPRLSKVLPGIRKKEYTIITSGTKESKTQLTNYLYIYQPIEWLMNNRDVDIDYKVKFFSLEMSRELMMTQAISYKLLAEFGELVGVNNLLSIFNEYTLEPRLLNLIESPKVREWFEFFEEKVEIWDSTKHPTGIMATVEKYARDNGKMYYKEVEWENGEKHKVIDKYVPNNPNEIVNTIVDHATLLSERGKTLYECIKTLSSDHFIKLKNVYGHSCTLVQQQSASSSEQQFNNRGENVLDKVRPTREGLTGNRDSGMDCTLMLGIFSPYKYKVSNYEDWDLNRIRDYHREVSILLNRSGKSNASIQMYFNGAASYFMELPNQEDNRVYDYVDKYRKIEESYTKD
jgi:hypothetical protein